ncbi:MAG: hypothetical protein DDT21_01827 [Syntrophomonadaceae bacterium]|nr:hypothetical protein [Bacillota bacterium]
MSIWQAIASLNVVLVVVASVYFIIRPPGEKTERVYKYGSTILLLIALLIWNLMD